MSCPVYEIGTDDASIAYQIEGRSLERLIGSIPNTKDWNGLDGLLSFKFPDF